MGGRRGVWAIYLLILLPVSVFMTLNGLLLDWWSDLVALARFFLLTQGVGILVG